MASEKNYVYFQRDVIFKGKHARYIDSLWSQNEIGEEDFFNRLYEIYIMAVTVGLRTNRKANADAADDDKRTILAQQVMAQSEKLNALMKLVLLLDDSERLSEEEKINRAFRGPKNDAEYNHHIELFNSYARGGIEYMYEQLKLRALDLNDKYTDTRVGNIMAFLENPFIEEI